MAPLAVAVLIPAGAHAFNADVALVLVVVIRQSVHPNERPCALDGRTHRAGSWCPQARAGGWSRRPTRKGATVAITPARPAEPLAVRPYSVADQDAVLALVEGDRLPGQPQATPGMLDQALAGHSPVDGDWWAELDTPRTDVVHDPNGRVRGVVS
ncbi:hypothetical protein ACFOSC_03765 [Streptantibioticus rubrisoli]|uniref:Uncharacterized protein n=1 Tax=Streptantibioticus rubrisoli TaxID=1387313 RepID=A0ABT1PM77_9ACTN|nr:hypothetical protein [Streptantibioticus rubrisoli]MCQ4045390.1 hypothetical protein [Streptantibioticus rubrisoli]